MIKVVDLELYANSSVAKAKLDTKFSDGISELVKWYKNFYGENK